MKSINELSKWSINRFDPRGLATYPDLLFLNVIFGLSLLGLRFSSLTSSEISDAIFTILCFFSLIFIVIDHLKPNLQYFRKVLLSIIMPKFKIVCILFSLLVFLYNLLLSQLPELFHFIDPFIVLSTLGVFFSYTFYTIYFVLTSQISKLLFKNDLITYPLPLFLFFQFIYIFGIIFLNLGMD